MEIILGILIIIYSIILHEVSHGYVAYKLGDPTAKYEKRLTLNPLSHLDPLGTIILPLLGYFFLGFIFGWAKPVPYNPYNLKNPIKGSILIALAGPITNILLALFFVFLFKLNFFPNFQEIFLLAIRINLILAFFNLLPIPPLDGSKLLLTKIPFFIYHQLEIYGFFFVFLFIYFFFPYFSKFISLIQNFLLNL
jgi:Zn-dependent protease